MNSNLVLIDTNCFLDHADILESYDNIVLNTTVLKELDNLKFKDSLSFSARSAIREIRSYLNSNKKWIFDTNQDSTMSNDMNIIMSAKRHGAKLITKDISMSILASSFMVECELKQDNLIQDFDCYTVDKNPEFPFESINLENDQLIDFKNYFQTKFDKEITPWTFYITNKDIFCYNPNKEMLECISKNKDYCKFEIEEGVVFKPRDLYQKAAVYSVVNSDATLLLGKWGVGKSLVAVATSLMLSKARRVFILRPSLKSKKYDIGFLPGAKQEKLYEFFSGFMSALATLYGNTRTSGGKDGISYDFVKEDLSKQKFEFLAMPELHGLSIQAGDIILVDEIQLLDQEYLALLLSRVGEGAKLVMMGDMNQTVNLIKNSESGLAALIRNLPNKAISAVELKNVYRNKDLCDLADKILK